jgi:hypothetical protein
VVEVHVRQEQVVHLFAGDAELVEGSEQGGAAGAAPVSTNAARRPDDQVARETGRRYNVSTR